MQREYGERFRRLLVELGLLDPSRKISSDDSFVYLPTRDIDEDAYDMLAEIAQFEKINFNFNSKIKELQPSDILGYEPRMDIVGDIAIVDKDDAYRVADAILATCKGIKAVIAPESDVEGEFRTRRFLRIAGEARTTTVHKEHGIRYHVDLEGAYFTPRLGTERLRIATQVKKGELVLDMFAGVGPFSLLLARNGANVVAIDKNPTAIFFMRENARLNKITNIKIFEGDAAEIALKYRNLADHVIMNLPHSASDFLVAAISAAKSGGIVHYYTIAPNEDLYVDENIIKKTAKDLGAFAEIISERVVRSYAPSKSNVVIDFKVLR